jgi:sugar lactone lactonase YvrE
MACLLRKSGTDSSFQTQFSAMRNITATKGLLTFQTARLRARLIGIVALLPAFGACARTTTPEGTAGGPKGSDESLSPLGRQIATLGDLHQPESVKYDADQDVFFISNMAGFGSDHDGNGYIVEVSAGNLANSRVFASSGTAGVILDAPKGMTIHGDTLWVCDIDVLRGFNRKTGMPLLTIDLHPYGAVLLNDVTIGGDGGMYITDTGILMTPKGVIHTGPDRIFAVRGGTVQVIAQGDSLGRPNGIVWDKQRQSLVAVSFDPFHSEVYTVSYTGVRHKLVDGNGKFDGIEPIGGGRYLVASWNDSSVRVVGNGYNRRVANNIMSPADIGLDTKRNRLAVPVGPLNQIQLWQLPAGLANR